MPNLDPDGDVVLLTPGGAENRFSPERVRAWSDLVDEVDIGLPSSLGMRALRTAPTRFPGAGR